MKKTWMIILALTLSLSSSCSIAPGTKKMGASGVLIIVVDALRADKLGVYGYERNVSPSIDDFAQDPDAVVYARHYVNAASTKKSTASLFTGLFVFQHGVLWEHEMRELPNRPGAFATQVLGERYETLAERFRDLGLYTFGVVKSHHLVPEYGFAQGFIDYFDPNDIRGDKKRVDKTIELIEEANGPFFGYLHLAGVHHPFEFKERHPLIMEEYGFDYNETARVSNGVDFTISETADAINDEGLTLETDDVRFLNLVYDASVRHVDEKYVDRLLSGLKEIGQYDDMLIILTADHGEELYEHRGYAHGHALWDEVIHVPMIVKFPTGRKPQNLGNEVRAVTQAIDLVPSLLSAFGQPAPERLPGTDIFTKEPRGWAYSETASAWALIEDRYKLIDTGELLFLSDLQEDSGELDNLAMSKPKRLAKMNTTAKALCEFVAVKPQNAPVTQTRPSKEAIEALRSLGYLR